MHTTMPQPATPPLRANQIAADHDRTADHDVTRSLSYDDGVAAMAMGGRGCMKVEELVARVPLLRLTTERLEVRRFEERYVAEAIEHELDPRIMRLVRDIGTREAAIEKAGGMVAPWRGGEGEWVGFAVTLRGGQAMLGLVSFRIVSFDNQSAELGYRLHPDHQRRGYAPEACGALCDFLFDVGGIRKIIAYCTSDNRASYRVMEKLGMQREGCLRQHSKLGDAWPDELVYGLLRDERREVR